MRVMKLSKRVVAWGAAALLVAGGTAGGIAIANPGTPVDDAPAKIVQEAPKTVDLTPEITPEPTQEPIAPEPAPEPEPVVEPAPAPAPKPAPAPAPKQSGAPSGTPLPMEDKGGGYMDYADPTTFCASKGGTTTNGVPSCA